MAKKPTLSAYKPSLREKAAILAERGFKAVMGREPGYEARENINRYTGLLDMLELPGMALSADDARRNIQSKRYGAAAGDLAGLAVGAFPMIGPPLKKGAKKVVKEGVEAATRLAAKYGTELPNLKVDNPVITGVEREANLARFLEGSQAPRDLYTGTSKDNDFEQFNVPKSGTWFTTDPESASAYSLENDSMTSRRIPGSFNFEDVNSASRVLPVYLRAKNPYRITDTQAFNKQLYALGGDNYKKAQGILFDKLREAGHDSVVLGTDPAEQVWVSLEGPNQMKSRFNQGTFDPKQKAMSKARGGLVRKYGC